MEYSEIRPRPPVSRWVRCFWFLCSEGRGAPGPLEDVFPDGCAEIVLHLGDPFIQETGGARRIQPLRIVVGASTGPVRIGPSGSVDVVGIRLEPHAVPVVLGTPGAEIVDRILELDDVATRPKWPERLHETSDLAARARLLEGWLGRRIDERRADAIVEAASAAIAAAGGRLPVSDICRELGVGARRLERRFQARLGIDPKTLCRITRFQRALGELGRGEAGLAGAAARCGYHDQAHLTRDFRAFAGRTPGSFLRSEEQLTAFFAGLGG